MCDEEGKHTVGVVLADVARCVLVPSVENDVLLVYRTVSSVAVAMGAVLPEVVVCHNDGEYSHEYYAAEVPDK